MPELAGGDRAGFAGRLSAGLLAGMESLSVYLGLWLGLYAALAPGPATAEELAERAGTDPRYTREWCEQQAVAGILTVDGLAAEPATRRFHLPGPHAEVLLDELAPTYAGPLPMALAGIAAAVLDLPAAFRSGAGIPYAAYGAPMRQHIARLNRVAFHHRLATEWLPAVPELHARLLAEPPARLADVVCGAGWSSIALARGYPLVTVDGFDLDRESVTTARRAVATAGLADRVRISCGDAAVPGLSGRYDAAFLFEALHDLPYPVAALAAVRRLLVPGGILLIADERVAEAFAAPGDELERLNYAFSVLHCLPASRTVADSAATGTCLRPATVRAYADAAGFPECTVAEIADDAWRFYVLRVAR